MGESGSVPATCAGPAKLSLSSEYARHTRSSGDQTQ